MYFCAFFGNHLGNHVFQFTGPLLRALLSVHCSQDAFSSDAVLTYRFCSVLKFVFVGYSYSFQRSGAYGAGVISVLLCSLGSLLPVIYGSLSIH